MAVFKPMRMESGVTLVELLAALTISAFLVVLASRIFLSGNQQFLDRNLESDRFEKMYMLKASIQKYLQKEILRCDSGKLWVKMDGLETDVQAALKKHDSQIQSSDFQCYEKSGSPISLVTWKDWYQPSLVEYQIVLLKSGVRDTLRGSWIK